MLSAAARQLRGAHPGHPALDAGVAHDADRVGRGVEDVAARAGTEHAVPGPALGRERPAGARVAQRPAAQRLHEVPRGVDERRLHAARRGLGLLAVGAQQDRVRPGEPQGIGVGGPGDASGQAPARPQDRPALDEGVVGLGVVVARQTLGHARGGHGIGRGARPRVGDHDQLAEGVGHGERRVGVPQVGHQLEVLPDVGEVVPDALREACDEFLGGHRASIRARCGGGRGPEAGGPGLRPGAGGAAAGGRPPGRPEPRRSPPRRNGQRKASETSSQSRFSSMSLSPSSAKPSKKPTSLADVLGDGVGDAADLAHARGRVDGARRVERVERACA